MAHTKFQFFNPESKKEFRVLAEVRVRSKWRRRLRAGAAPREYSNSTSVRGANWFDRLGQWRGSQNSEKGIRGRSAAGAVCLSMTHCVGHSTQFAWDAAHNSLHRRRCKGLRKAETGALRSAQEGSLGFRVLSRGHTRYRRRPACLKQHVSKQPRPPLVSEWGA
jgi:hypothetical protein